VRILVVGAGAVGGYFGGRLAIAKRDVTFLVRERRAEQLRARGLQLTDPRNETIVVDAKIALASELRSSFDTFGTFDAVLLAVKAYDLEATMDDFAPAVGPHTAIVPFLNGMRHIGMLVARFGEERVAGGVCLVATKLEPDGRIVQLNDMQSLTYGERGGERSERMEALDAALGGAGFEAALSENIMQAMWDKWVVLATLGATTCLMRGTIGEIARAPGGADVTRALFAECAAVAAASGYPTSDEYRVRTLTLLTAAGSELTSSMYRDLISGNRVEGDQILGDMVERARGLGVETPMLGAAFAHVSVYFRRAHPSTGSG
jgi:2-dehydropantoate 2-reductase